MVSRLLLISVLTLAVNFVESHIALAENFTSHLCSFSEKNSGTLVPETGMHSTRLVSFETAGGSPTEISITCKQAVNFSVLKPIQLAGPAIEPTSTFVRVETSSGKSISSDEISTLSLPMGTTTLLFNLAIDGGKPLPAGNYRYGFKFNVVSSE
ncbi:hypothetical protein [Mastigocoleus testarum]|uniref:Spore coat protein U domain-containing protein n=1 Tax=Mastigocoleus testarum BC008 TaxID=371196 RepID=A0A0V7ZGY7_9CYAN|nr:hypothetical protein [Mastigocoleus testarum]KST63690.1 hypothetical protein BC008_14635 [Mastigocoleus testarum BC008]KST63768.1 hypothetical protein BC008_15040 [Mastigocoleus testarum BC008]